MRKAPLALVLLFFVQPALAQGLWLFDNKPYYDPLIAGVREPHLSALALASADRVDFMVKKDSPRRIWDIDVGGELPLVGWQSTNVDEIPEDKFGVGLWAVIDFHTLEDFVDNSAPIVNTDYRFGGMIKARYGLKNARWLAARLHFGHESTHLGDEFSIVGQRVFPRSFERINVSWEYVDLGVLYETPGWGVRGGVTTTLPFNDSYYTTDPAGITQSPLGPVTPSANWCDPYLGFEVLRPRQFQIKKTRFDVYYSGELRWRSIYDYHKADPDASEERQASINLIAGVKETGDAKGFGRASPFIRFYRGVNPHGQFRNQKSYKEFGIGVRLVR